MNYCERAQEFVLTMKRKNADVNTKVAEFLKDRTLVVLFQSLLNDSGCIIHLRGQVSSNGHHVTRRVVHDKAHQMLAIGKALHGPLQRLVRSFFHVAVDVPSEALPQYLCPSLQIAPKAPFHHEDLVARRTERD